MDTTERNSGKTVRHTYHSLREFAETAAKHPEAKHAQRATSFEAHTNLEQAADLCANGWREGLTEAMPLAEEAVEAVEQEISSTRMEPYFDVTGGEVDVGRFVQGVPECMVDYEPRTISKVGGVITLCASVSVSGAVHADNLKKRGRAMVALALALERTGHETEIWVEFATTQRTGSDHRGEVRVKVKGPNDVVDPERLAFALGHPAMLRQLMFAAMHEMPRHVQRACRIGSSYGTPAAAHEDLPEGTIYLPHLLSNEDIEDPQDLILDTLREVGLLREQG